MNCQNCNTTTTNPKFCSRSCAAVYNNTTKPKRKRLGRRCTACGEIFIRFTDIPTRRCKTCTDDAAQITKKKLSMTLKEMHEELCVKGKHPSWKNAVVRIIGRQLHKELLQSCCTKCGYSKHVELAHIKPITEFDESATLAEVHASSNVIALCRNCHWEMDNLENWCAR